MNAEAVFCVCVEGEENGVEGEAFPASLFADGVSVERGLEIVGEEKLAVLCELSRNKGDFGGSTVCSGGMKTPPSVEIHLGRAYKSLDSKKEKMK